MGNYTQRKKILDDDENFTEINIEAEEFNNTYDEENDLVSFQFSNKSSYTFDPIKDLVDPMYDVNNINRLRYTNEELVNMNGWLIKQKELDYKNENNFIYIPKILNQMQNFAFNIINHFINNNQQLLMIVIGSGGVGKSELIFKITNFYNKERVKTCAPSAKAAILINGETVHSLFSIPTNYTWDYVKLTPKKKRELQDLFEGKVKQII